MILNKSLKYDSEFLNQFLPQTVTSDNLACLLLWLTYSCKCTHKVITIFYAMLWSKINDCLPISCPSFKIPLAVNCSYSQSNGTVQVFATAQSFVMQLKDKYVFIFPTIQLYFCQRVVKVKRKIFVGKWVKNNEKCNRYRWYCSS